MANPTAPTEPMEPIYGVQLFDDLHMYLPDILYNSDRFATVPDLLQYVQNQTRAHFNLFNRGRLLYQAQQMQPVQEGPLSLPRRAQRPSPAASAVPPPASAVPYPTFPPAPPPNAPLLSAPLLSAPLRSAIATALQEPHAEATESATAGEDLIHTIIRRLTESSDVSGQDVSTNATPVTTPRPAVMLSTPTPPRPASVLAAGGAGAGAGAANTPLFTTTYSGIRGFNSGPNRSLPNAPFHSSRVEPSVLFQFDTNGPGQFGEDVHGLGNTSQLLTSLLGLAFGDTTGGLGGLGGLGTFGGLPASFLEPVIVRPTIAQIDAASEVLTLSAPLEGNCAVCQDTLETGNEIRRLTACTHAFHQECIDTWFERSVQCPVCRHDVRETATSQVPVPAPASPTSSDLD